MKTGIVDAVNLRWKLASACDDSEHVASLDLRLAAGFPRMIVAHHHVCAGVYRSDGHVNVFRFHVSPILSGWKRISWQS